jgi:nucleotide-binding universal stress UspA family protein
MMMENPASLADAIEDFRRARNQANLKELISRLTGESNQLLSYDEVRQRLKLQGGMEKGIQDIPLDAIVGSVGRYSDFTRDFLPRQEVAPDRWARILVAANGLVGLPPIEVYKIGEVYFVMDGNHRVSVARQLEATHIQAYVTEVQTHVPITPDITPDDLILKAEYNEFLEQTRLDRLRPGSDLSVTAPGQYPILLEHIEVHLYFMGIDFQRTVSYPEAVTHWYDYVYLPVVEIIRQQGILHDFPKRTETDLYLWIAEHRREFEIEFGFPVRIEYVVSHLAADHKPGLINKLGNRLRKLVVPESLESGPPIGKWRMEVADRPEDRLFIELLVPLNGKEDGWCAQEQAIRIAQRESGILHGLHVVLSDEDEPPDLRAIQDEFNRRCWEGHVQGSLVISQGNVVEQTCWRATATDLVVMNLTYPPGVEPISRLQSGFPNLLRRCPRPVLITPQTISDLSHAILSFDGSPKSFEAMYVTTYLVKKWGASLHVISVEDGTRVGEHTLDQAKGYLEKHDVQAEYHLERGDPGEAVLKVCEEEGSDLIIMGGYGRNPVLEVVLGSTVDNVLRHSSVPVLICR